jgi:hypothetical protein
MGNMQIKANISVCKNCKHVSVKYHFVFCCHGGPYLQQRCLVKICSWGEVLKVSSIPKECPFFTEHVVLSETE